MDLSPSDDSLPPPKKNVIAFKLILQDFQVGQLSVQFTLLNLLHVGDFSVVLGHMMFRHWGKKNIHEPVCSPKLHFEFKMNVISDKTFNYTMFNGCMSTVWSTLFVCSAKAKTEKE